MALSWLYCTKRMIWLRKEMFDISRIGHVHENYFTLSIIILSPRWKWKKLGNGLKAIIGRGRFFGGCICPAAGFTYLCFKTSFTSIYVYRWPEDSSLCLILIFSWEEYWNVSWKNLESKSWLDSKILINICGFISTTVIFASLFSLFFASVDRFS